MLAAAQQEDDGAFFLQPPTPPSHSLMHGSYVQLGGAVVLLFSWEGAVTAQPCGGEEEEEEEEMGRAVCRRGAQPRDIITSSLILVT